MTPSPSPLISSIESEQRSGADLGEIDFYDDVAHLMSGEHASRLIHSMRHSCTKIKLYHFLIPHQYWY